MSKDHNVAFILRIPSWSEQGDKRFIVITVWDTGPHVPPHFRLDVEVRHRGKVIFPKGQLWAGVNAVHATDGKQAKALACSLVAMRKGDTDADYFVGYTQDQLDWASEWGEYISDYSANRFGEG